MAVVGMDEVQGHNTDMEEPIQEEDLMKSSLRMLHRMCRIACLETSRAGTRQWKKSGVGGMRASPAEFEGPGEEPGERSGGGQKQPR